MIHLEFSDGVGWVWALFCEFMFGRSEYVRFR